MENINADQDIRDRALQRAVMLDNGLPNAIAMRTDDFSDGRDMTENDAVLHNQKVRMVEQAATDRVLRHARLFAEYISTGLAYEDLDEQASRLSPPG